MDASQSSGVRRFETTHWSLVSLAQSGEASSTDARLALESLCRAYWYPIYSFVRHKGHAPADAQDLTQSFLLTFIERHGFAAADPERGRFRTYLLGALKHFLSNEWQRLRTAKRGGNMRFLEWDALKPEERYALEPAQSLDADLGYDREWALELIERARCRLREEAEASGKLEEFEVLKGCLSGGETPRTEIAERLGLSEGAVKVAVHRLRVRFRSFLRAEIAETLKDRSEVDDEMRHLVAVLRNKSNFS